MGIPLSRGGGEGYLHRIGVSRGKRCTPGPAASGSPKPRGVPWPQTVFSQARHIQHDIHDPNWLESFRMMLKRLGNGVHRPKPPKSVAAWGPPRVDPRSASGAPLCDIPSGCCSFTGPWTVTRSSLRMLRRVFLSAAAAGALAGVVSAFAEPSIWCVGTVLDVAWCAVCVSAAPNNWRIEDVLPPPPPPHWIRAEPVLLCKAQPRVHFSKEGTAAPGVRRCACGADCRCRAGSHGDLRNRRRVPGRARRLRLNGLAGPRREAEVCAAAVWGSPRRSSPGAMRR